MLLCYRKRFCSTDRSLTVNPSALDILLVGGLVRTLLNDRRKARPTMLECLKAGQESYRARQNTRYPIALASLCFGQLTASFTAVVLPLSQCRPSGFVPSAVVRPGGCCNDAHE